MSNISRRGFLSTLLACACTGTILSSTDLLVSSPDENRWTEIVRLARDVVEEEFDRFPWTRESSFTDRQDLKAVKTSELFTKFCEISWKSIPGEPQARPGGFLLSPGFLPRPVTISLADQTVLNSHQPDPEWGMLDEAELEKLSAHLVPFAIFREVMARHRLATRSHALLNYVPEARDFDNLVGCEIAIEPVGEITTIGGIDFGQFRQFRASKTS